MSEQIARVAELRRSLIEEIVQVMGFSTAGWPARLLAPLCWPPAQRFARLAARFDQAVTESGLREAASWVLPHFVPGVRAHGTDAIPREGPLLIAANHPGAVDGLAIVANVPRNDLKVIATARPFVQGLPGVRDHLIYTPREGAGRTTTVRETMRHLEAGGALLIFPRGQVEPDPALLPGAAEEMGGWSRSLELILRRHPDTQVLITIVSDVLSPRWLHHPLVRLRKEARERQLLAEFLQIIQQMVLGIRSGRIPQVTFGPPVTVAELVKGDSSPGLLPSIIELARRLLSEHLAVASGRP